MRGVRKQGNYTNPCLTMHQPWASLLVYGIKRIEGRSWPAPLRGRLWIHAASKIPEEATIKAMEEFYREIYAVNGITDLNFPQHYPVSRLLGCVEVVGCVRCEELASWEVLPEGVRLEGQTDFCWLCENPQKLLVPFEMRGYQGVYNLEKKVYEAAVRGLIPVKVPLPVKFPLPNSQDPFSLKPGSLSVYFPENKSTTVEKSSTLNAAIAGAREAASQFHKKNQDLHTNVMQNEKPYSLRSRSENKSSGGDAFKHGTSALAEDGERNLIEHEESSSQDQPRRHLKRDLGALKQGTSALAEDGERNLIEHEESSSHDQPLGHLKRDLGAPSRIFAAAVRGLKPS